MASSYQTLKLGKLALPKRDPLYTWPFGRAKLALTGVAIAGFVVKHLFDFHFPVSEGIASLYQHQVNFFPRS